MSVSPTIHQNKRFQEGRKARHRRILDLSVAAAARFALRPPCPAPSSPRCTRLVEKPSPRPLSLSGCFLADFGRGSLSLSLQKCVDRTLVWPRRCCATMSSAGAAGRCPIRGKCARVRVKKRGLFFGRAIICQRRLLFCQKHSINPHLRR